MSYLLLYLFFFLCPVKKDIPANIYDFKVAAFKGNDIDLSAYKGKKILIVNAPVMSYDDQQYKELETLYNKYSGKLVVIGILSDDYNIEPGTKLNRDYHKIVYPVTFPLSTKMEVAGKEISPIFAWLTQKQYNNYKESHVKWNFQKYLIDERGKLIAVFDPKVKPLSKQIIAAIES